MAINCVYRSLKESWRKDGDPHSWRALTRKLRSIHHLARTHLYQRGRDCRMTDHCGNITTGEYHLDTFRTTRPQQLALLFELLSFSSSCRKKCRVEQTQETRSDWMRGVITFCCCVHLVQFFTSHGPMLFHNRCVWEFRKRCEAIYLCFRCLTVTHCVTVWSLFFPLFNNPSKRMIIQALMQSGPEIMMYLGH